MAKYICIFCSYIYDEEVGDPKHGFPPGTKYADLPNTWVCPLCLVPKTKPGLFRKIED
ncbi:MAG TPA: rubredoxin [Methanocorpusculum sp.]|nr:rubredoxin [Methanocorpusculum sp.]